MINSIIVWICRKPPDTKGNWFEICISISRSKMGGKWMRTTADVFDSHLLYTLDWDMDTDIELNYAPHCYLLSSYGVFFGRMGIRKAFDVLESQIPEANFLYTTKTVYNDIAFLEWQAEAADTYIDDGVDTFIINNGKIVIQTMHYTVKTREK